MNIQQLNEMKNREENPVRKLIISSVLEMDLNKRNDLHMEVSRNLTRPNGVLDFFLALVDFDPSSELKTTHNQRFVAVSKIITRLKKLCLPYEQFCENIFEQIKPMLTSDNPVYSSLACIVINSMLESEHANHRQDKIVDIIFGPIFKALQESPCQKIVFKPHETFISIHNMLQNHIPAENFVEVFPHLFNCLIVLQNTPSRFKTMIKNSLVDILDGLESGVAICLLEQTVFYKHCLTTKYAAEEEGGEISVKVVDDIVNQHSDKFFMKDTIICLLENCRNEFFVFEFFLHFREILWTADDNDKCFIASLVEPLEKETFQDKLFKLVLLDGDKLLDLILRTLLNNVAFLKSGFSGKPDHQSVSFCLNILEVLRAANVDVQTKSLPMLEELRILLAKYERDEVHDRLDSLVDTMKSGGLICQDSADTKVAEDYKNIIKDLDDRLVPIRVHALVRLKQMIVANEKFVVSKIPELFTIVEAHLFDQESYVYLACINLIVEMTVKKTDILIQKLKALYTDEDVEVSARTNVGEILVRVAKQMNETTPIYAQQVLDTFIINCGNADERIRASNLTLIGEICRNLPHSLGKYMVRILNLIETVIDTDTLFVKCAAIDLLRTTLMGINRSTAEAVQRDLKSTYHLLKKQRIRTLDDKLCVQLDLALDEMDRLARELILGDMDNRHLVKEIKVMSL